MNRQQSKHITIVAPQIYHIVAPESIRQRARFKNINSWGWMNLQELLFCCTVSQAVACETLGYPTVPSIPWATSGWFELIKSFGLLMSGNTDLPKHPVYTYVRCYDTVPPEEGDFFLESYVLPVEPEHRVNSTYVPAGWGKRVLELIHDGVYLISFDPEDQRVLIAHLFNGKNIPFKGRRIVRWEATI
jgi:hypothetical protein